jgi:hypothetical protein
VGNFQLGRSSYSYVSVHPNGHDIVVVAGGAGYIVRPDERKLVATFAGGVMGIWPVAALNLLVFNDSGVAFAALGSEGWRWMTRRVSWDGFEGIEVAEKTIYGRGWNAVSQCWQPFSIEIATGIVRGGGYSEAAQQRIARSRELTLRGSAPLPLIAKRIAELAIGLFAIVLVLLTVYLIVDGVRIGELTWAKTRDNWGLAYPVLFLTAVVLVVGVRLVFPSLAPQGRLLTRTGIIACVGVYLAVALVMFLKTGLLPTFLVVVVAVALGRTAISKWFS